MPSERSSSAAPLVESGDFRCDWSVTTRAIARAYQPGPVDGQLVGMREERAAPTLSGAGAVVIGVCATTGA